MLFPGPFSCYRNNCCSAGFQSHLLEIKNAWISNANTRRNEDSLGREISLPSAPLLQSPVHELKQYSRAFYCLNKQKPAWRGGDSHNNALNYHYVGLAGDSSIMEQLNTPFLNALLTSAAVYGT